MIASKVTISPETLAGNKLSRARTRELREQKVIDYIKSKPYGTPMNLDRFVPILGVKRSTAALFLKQMIKQSKIERRYVGNRQLTYLTVSPVTTRKLDQPAPKSDSSSEPSLTPVPPRPAPYNNVLSLVADLKRLGVDFEIRIGSRSSEHIKTTRQDQAA